MHRSATRMLSLVLLASVLPLSAQAAESPPSGLRAEIRQDLEEARQEVRTDMDKARAELETEDLSVRDTLQFGETRRETARRRALPPAAITPRGDFVVDGKRVAVDAGQRRQLLDYRRLIVEIARIGIDGGEKAAMAALDATDVSMFRLVVGGLSGGLERRVEASTRRQVAPLMLQICQRLPQVLDEQQKLVAGVPEFGSYATLDAGDVEDCKDDVRTGLAAR